MKLRNTIYYEFYDVPYPTDGALPVHTGMKVLEQTTIVTGIDTVPTLSMTIPLEELPDAVINDIENGISAEPRLQHYAIKVHFQIGGIQKYIFLGIVDNMQIDDARYKVKLNLSHIVARMREWPMPVNCTIKDMPIKHALGQYGVALGYPSTPDGNMQGGGEQVVIRYENPADGNTPLEMTFGSNNKLEALSETVKNTEKLHFYVDIAKPNEIVIGQFGQDSNVITSPYPYLEDDCDEYPNQENQYVTMLTEPMLSVDYTSHFNRAIIFCGDVAYGVAHLTLQYIHDHPEEQDPKFPVGKYEYARDLLPQDPNGYGFDSDNKRINNEKIYSSFDTIAMQVNGNAEYYVTDLDQLAEDDQMVLDTTYNFNDLYPIPSLKRDVDNDGEEEDVVITEADRKEMVRRAYRRAIRKLKVNRPGRVYQFSCEALPQGVTDGQKITLQYSKSVNTQSEGYDTELDSKKVVNVDARFYLTRRTIVFDEVMNEYTQVTLDSELRTRDVAEGEVLLYPNAEPSGNDVTYESNFSGYLNDTR